MRRDDEPILPPERPVPPPRPTVGLVSRRTLLTTTGVAAAALAATDIGCRAAPAAGSSVGGDIQPTSDAPVVAPRAPADDAAWTTADVILEKLLAWKVTLVFGIPGDGINPHHGRAPPPQGPPPLHPGAPRGGRRVHGRRLRQADR